VSGKTLYAFVSPSPLYKDLSTDLDSGTQVGNVKTLQAALKKAGYYSGAIDGDFDASTESALEDWQDAKGMTASGTLDIARFVWVPKGSTLDAWSVSIGSSVKRTTALATVIFKRPLLAQVLVGQDEIDSLEVGQKAQLAIDGYDGATFTGTVATVAKQPSSSGSGGSSSGYAVTLKLRKLPAFARQGMTGTLKIVLARKTDVLVVPTTAVVGSGSSAAVRLLQNGRLVFRTVTTGLSTSSYTEITSGLVEGEKVVTSVITEGSGETAGTGAFPGRGSFLPGGGYPPGGGSMPQGGGAPPTGGGQ